jgi:transcriptional regulator with GAF, ATPase, and Fis domain
MRDALRDLRRFARTDLPALITGETGTGKELFARELHRLGFRAERPFVAVSCPNLPAQLVESELLGHRRGAFTGAVDSRVGAFEAADGGTLFLDEIGEMPLDVQARILRVLQEGTLRRLGENREVRVDVRVVAATHRDLGAMVAAGAFREDLYHRLACFVLHLPPLRERGHDVVRIARALLAEGVERHGLPRRALSREAEDALRAEPWPGNVRELQRALFRAAATGTGRSIQAVDLARALGRPAAAAGEATLAPATVEAVLHERRVLGAADLRAALGVSRSEMSRRLAPLLAEGRVVREGGSSGTRYRLAGGTHGASIPDARWALALEIARRDGRVTRTALAAAAGGSERTATRVLAAMVEAGVLVEDGGKGRGAGYLAAGVNLAACPTPPPAPPAPAAGPPLGAAAR